MSIYMSIPNVTGDTTSTLYPKQFAVLSAQWAGSENSTGGTGGKASFSTFSVSMNGSINSPELMLLMAQGKRVGTVVITMTITTPAEYPIHIYTLSNAVISSISQTMESSGRPSQTLLFTFTRLTYSSFFFNGIQQTGPVTHYWDVSTNNGE
jgi:type VI protein secretion system component Hcp